MQMYVSLSLLLVVAAQKFGSANIKLSGLDKIVVASQSDFCKGSGATDGTGKQVQQGTFCSSTIQGIFPDVSKQPSTMISEPAPGSTVDGAKGFTVNFAVNNFNSGFAADAETQFLAAPQTIGGNGFIEGAIQLAIQAIPDPSKPPSASSVDFFTVPPN
jgi:hypothetical protein